MKKVVLAFALVAVAMLGLAAPGRAQFARYDYIWARSTNGAPLTLDGKLNEPLWAQAESLVIDGHVLGPIPGSGFKAEGGFLSADQNRCVIKFLTVGNYLWLGATVRDSSIGGSEIFNYFDGLLMNIRQHDSASRPAPAGEHFMSWWWPAESRDVTPRAAGKDPSTTGRWRSWARPTGADSLDAWNTAYTIKGVANDDASPDTSYTFEMYFNLTKDGYNITQPAGDIVEWNASLYDNDWYWPLANFFRWGVMRTWVQSPWGNTSWYSDVHVMCRPDVTVNTATLPALGPDLQIPNAVGWSAPTIDGLLNEPIWQYAGTTHIKFGDVALRNSYANTGPWRSGQFQADVNGGTAFVQDPADCLVKYFWKGSKLYIGMDFNDQVVQFNDALDRYDGAIITINDRVKRYSDNNLLSYRMAFQVGPSGELVAHDDLLNLRDTLHAVTCDLKLKAGTTVDTVGYDLDAGYTAEFEIDLTQMGYTPDLGDHTLYFGVDVLDGDSYTPITDSYGTRTWFFRQYQYEDGPCVAFMNPNLLVTSGVAPGTTPPGRLELLGNFPNPFRTSTTLHFRLPQASRLSVDVFDLQGRLVASRVLGVQPAGEGHARVPQFASHSGVYLYRLHAADANTGAALGTLSGKMMVLE